MSANQDRYETGVARYFEAWNAGEDEALTKAVAAAWATDGSYTDPPPRGGTPSRCQGARRDRGRHRRGP